MNHAVAVDKKRCRPVKTMFFVLRRHNAIIDKNFAIGVNTKEPGNETSRKIEIVLIVKLPGCTDFAKPSFTPRTSPVAAS
jgi:hypothetical protein